MKNYISEADRTRLAALFSSGAARVKTEPEHWIHGHDEGESYCHACATAKVAALLKAEPDEEYCVDGGWGGEGDSTPFCKCGKQLENSFTNYACESEIEHFLGNGFDPRSDGNCHSLDQCISSRGWEPYDFQHYRDYERRKQLEYFDDLHALCRAILNVLDNPRPRDEAKAEQARRNAMRCFNNHRARNGYKRGYWWRVYHRWANVTPAIAA